jgi:hypothetical protein
MKTAELKVGDWVIRRNGWPAQVLEESSEQDDLCICCMVHGWYTEGGSIYCHDIVAKIVPLTDTTNGQPWCPIKEGDMADEHWVVDEYIEHTPEQVELREEVLRMGM